MKVSEAKKIRRTSDCVFYREGRSHEIWLSGRTGKKFQVPRHDAKELPEGTWKAIKKSAGIE